MMSLARIYLVFYLLQSGFEFGLGWLFPLQTNKASTITSSLSPAHSASSKSITLSRRSFLVAVPTATVTVVTSAATPLPAYSITSDAAKDQWKRSLDVIDNLLNNWSGFSSGDSIRVELGTQGTTSPLFQIDKALKVLREEAEDLIEFTEQAEEFQLTLARADSMAYSANFAGGSGKPTPPAVYIEKAKKEVIELQKIAKALTALL